MPTKRTDKPPAYVYRSPPEVIVRADLVLAAFNADHMLRDRKFIVDLACGHKAYTNRQRRIVCPRCSEMLRRSCEDGSEDYESFRKGLVPDRMEWEGDQCRQFNEPGYRPDAETRTTKPDMSSVHAKAQRDVSSVALTKPRGHKKPAGRQRNVRRVRTKGL